MTARSVQRTTRQTIMPANLVTLLTKNKRSKTTIPTDCLQTHATFGLLACLVCFVVGKKEVTGNDNLIDWFNQLLPMDGLGLKGLMKI